MGAVVMKIAPPLWAVFSEIVFDNCLKNNIFAVERDAAIKQRKEIVLTNNLNHHTP